MGREVSSLGTERQKKSHKRQAWSMSERYTEQNTGDGDPCAGYLDINLTQGRVIRKEGASVEKMPS